MLNFEEIMENQDENSFVNVINILGTKNLIKCFRSALYDHEICCITQNEILLKNLKNHFLKIFDKLTPKITVVTPEKYQEYTKEKRKRKDKKNNFIFDHENDKIIKQPFSKNFRPDKFKLEISILKNTDLKSLDNQQVLDQLNGHFNKIVGLCKGIINDISMKKIIDKYQMRSIVESSKENVDFTFKDIEHILKYRFDYKPIFIPESALNTYGTDHFTNW